MPLTIRRPRLERWLKAYAQSPVRLVVAPAGSGKTSLLLKYASDSETEAAYCALPPRCDAQQLRELLARAVGASRLPETYAALLEVVSGSPAHCVEIVVDDVDNADDESIAELLRLVEEVTENVTFIYAARSRERIDARRLVARGVGALCDARRLAFDAQEAEVLAEACGAPHSDLEIRRLVDETDGWAMALCAAIRTAAAEDEMLGAAFERWRTQSSAFLYEFVSAELEHVSESDRRIFWDMYEGQGAPGAQRLHELEARGLFVHDDGAGHLRMYRALERRAAHPQTHGGGETLNVPPMMVRMFRSFEATINGRDIPWVRKRDQQIVKYLLLKPEGKASRAELASVFWSGTDRHLATQSVRTACSTIRKAIAAVVGYSAVGAYFRTTPDVQIDLSNIACDARRFLAHIVDAGTAFAREDVQSAAMHYRAAEKLYAGGLLEFEQQEPWFATQARYMQDRFLLALERLGEKALDEGQHAIAQQYVRRAQGISADQPGIARLAERVAAEEHPKQSGGAPRGKRIGSIGEMVRSHAQLQSV